MQNTIIKRRESKSKDRKLPEVMPLYKGIFLAEIVEGDDLRLDAEHEMRKWKETIVCLKCATKIEWP